MSPEMWGNFAHVPMPIMLHCCGRNWQELLGLWARLLSPSSVLGLQPKHVQEAQLSCRQTLASNRAEGYQGIEAVSWGGEDEGKDWHSREGAMPTPHTASKLPHL